MCAKLLIVIFIITKVNVLVVLSADEENYDKTCLMDSICKRGGVKTNSPCHQMHAPYDNVTDDDFYELLSTNCPHYFNHKGELLHRLCCSPEQEESVTRLLNYADLISRSCPACAVNAKKYFCNMYCLPNQNQMIKIEKTSGKSVLNVSYVVSKKFAQTLFESCYDVKLFGGYLMDLKYTCGQHKRDNCDATKFLTTLGALSQMPLVIHPVITDKAWVTIGGHSYTPMSTDAYQCYEAPPGENKCSCDNCDHRCNETMVKNLAHNLTLNQLLGVHVFIIALSLVARILF